MTYAEKLRDPRWQKKRLELFNDANWRCQYCGAKDVELHIHHLRYLPRTEPWDYANDLYVVACKMCHVERQEAENRFYGAIAIATRLVPGRRLDKVGGELIAGAFKEMGLQ